MAVYALAALGFAAVWGVEIVNLFDPDFNEDRTLGDEFLTAQAIVGFFGVLLTVIAGGAGLAFATTAVRRWLVLVALSTACAFPLLAFWLFFLAGPAGSG